MRHSTPRPTRSGPIRSICQHSLSSNFVPSFFHSISPPLPRHASLLRPFFVHWPSPLPKLYPLLCHHEAHDPSRPPRRPSPVPHRPLLRNPHLQLGSPGLNLTLLVQLPPSRQCPLSLSHRQTSWHTRLADHPHAPRRHGLQPAQRLPRHCVQQRRPGFGSLRRQYRG